EPQAIRRLGHSDAGAVSRGPAEPEAAQLAFDTGGTFTDIIRVDPAGTVTAAKLLAAADEVGDVVAGILDSVSVSRFRHATTVVANALIEGHGAPVALTPARG